MNEKKALERSFLDEVRPIYPNFPFGATAETEQPDFLIFGQSHITGVEVVRYVRGQGKDRGGSADRRNDALRQQITVEARRKFELSHSGPLMIHFLWHPGRHLRKRDVHEIAAEAANIVEQSKPHALFDKTRIADDELLDTALGEFVSSIMVTRVRNERQVLWSSIDAGFVSVSPSELQQLIALKNAKVPDYLRRCDEVWLLIVADGSYISSTADLPEDIHGVRFPSLFRKVLFYDRPDRRIVTLSEPNEHL